MSKKINIFDIVIIVALLVAALAGYKMIAKTGNDALEAVSEVSFTVEIANCENDLANKINVGDDIYDSVKGGYYGKVQDVQIKPSKLATPNPVSGKYDLVEYPNRQNVHITIKGTPTSVSEGNIQFASQKVKVGTVAYLRSKNYVGFGHIIDIDISE